MFSSTLLALIGAATLSSAHTVLTYPGWRGDNLITNDSFPYGMQWMYPCKSPRPRSLSPLVAPPASVIPAQSPSIRPSTSPWRQHKLTSHPPAGGGHPTTTNRTYWPTTGGALSFQPGWFQGHATAFLYVNMGFGTDGPDGGPWNMSFPMVAPFQILGPSKNPYPGTVCLPQVPLPANTTVQPGDNATIQVVELAVHGASLFSVSSPCPVR